MTPDEKRDELAEVIREARRTAEGYALYEFDDDRYPTTTFVQATGQDPDEAAADAALVWFDGQADPFSRLCAEIEEWWRNAFPDDDMKARGLCLAEETGELCRTILKESHGENDRRADTDWKAERRTEFGDVGIALLSIAMLDGFDPFDALAERFEYVKARFPGALGAAPQEPQTKEKP